MDTDAELIAQATDGNNDAFGTLVRRHEVAIYRYLSRRSESTSIEDLLADVWITAFRSRHSFDVEYDSALPWLYGIARNVLRNHWRHSRRPAVAGVESHDPWSAVDDRLAATDASRRLSETIGSLTEEQREVLLLVAWEELSPSEAATVLGIPPSTARSHLRRARLSLRHQAAALMDPES